MEEEEDKSTLGFLQKLKQKAESQTTYGFEDYEEQDQVIAARNCPNCGAARALKDGLTHCAYCGFEFMGVALDKGIFINNKPEEKR